MPNIGETIYWENGSSHVQASELHGETSRSWIVFGGRHKLRKNETKLTTKEAYEAYLWAQRNRWKIRMQIEFMAPEKLKKVAELIGFVE